MCLLPVRAEPGAKLGEAGPRGGGWGLRGGSLVGRGAQRAGAEPRQSVSARAPELLFVPEPGTARPGEGGRRAAAMAPPGLLESAVLAAAVFVGSAVSSPLVAPGECPVAAGARRRRRGIGTVVPLLLELPWSWHSRRIPALNIWLSGGGPGRARRVEMAPVPPSLLGSRLPSSEDLLPPGPTSELSGV